MGEGRTGGAQTRERGAMMPPRGTPRGRDRALPLSLPSRLLCALCLGAWLACLPAAQAVSARCTEGSPSLGCQEQSSSESRSSSRSSSRTRSRILASQDPCRTLYTTLQVAPRYASTGPGSQVRLVRPSALRACALRSPVNKATQLQDLNNVRLHLASFYPLLHVAKQSPSTWAPSQYNVLTALDALKNKTFSSSEDFYLAMHRAVRGLNDGSTQLLLQNTPVYTLGLNLVATLENGQPGIRVAPAALQDKAVAAAAAKKPFSFGASKFYGSKVASIDGVDAWKYMTKWARLSAGSFHNPVNRLNAAFAGLQWSSVSGQTRPSLGLRMGEFSQRIVRPPKDYIEIVAFGGTGGTLFQLARVPWLAGVQSTNLRNYRSTAAYRAFLNTPAPKPPPTVSTLRAPGVRRRSRAAQTLRAPVVAPALSQAVRLSASNEFWPVFRLKGTRTGVLVISTFDITSLDTRDDDTFFVQETYLAFSTLIRANVTQVIIDLSSNPGGATKYAYWLVEMLVGTSKFQGVGNNFLRSLADSNITKLLVQREIATYNFSQYSDTKGVPFIRATKGKFWIPTQKLAFGTKGVPGYYSSFCQETIRTLPSKLGKPQVPMLPGKKLLFLSDGLCYGTCGTFAAIMQQRFKATLVTSGGLPRSYTSFAGGAGGFSLSDVETDLVAKWANVWAIRSQPNAPRAFLGPITLSLKNGMGFLNQNSPFPMDFDSYFGYKLSYTSLSRIQDPSVLYNDARKYFK